jgi:hypothetical protein
VAGEDPEYTEFLRGNRCHMTGHGDCIGAVHVHHAQGRKGLGTRNHDHDGKPLCTGHHTQRHSLSGPFKGWTKERIRAWESETSAHYRGIYLGLGVPDDF